MTAFSKSPAPSPTWKTRRIWNPNTLLKPSNTAVWIVRTGHKRWTRPGAFKIEPSPQNRLLPALLPFRASEQMRPDFNEPRQHLENGDRSPSLTLAGSTSAPIQFSGNARIRALLDHKLHHLKQSVPLIWIFL